MSNKKYLLSLIENKVNKCFNTKDLEKLSQKDIRELVNKSLWDKISKKSKESFDVSITQAYIEDDVYIKETILNDFFSNYDIECNNKKCEYYEEEYHDDPRNFKGVCDKCVKFIKEKINENFITGLYEKEWDEIWKEYNNKNRFDRQDPIIKLANRMFPINIIQKLNQHNNKILESTYSYSWFFVNTRDVYYKSYNTKNPARITLMISSVIDNSDEYEGHRFLEHGNKKELNKGIDIFNRPEYMEISTAMNSTIPLATFKLYDLDIYFDFAKKFVNMLNTYIFDIVAVIGDNYIGAARNIDDYCWFLRDTFIAARASKSSTLNRNNIPRDVFFYIIKMIFE